MILFGVATDVCDHAAIMGLLARQYSVALRGGRLPRARRRDFVAHSFELWRAGGVRFTTTDEVVGT